MNQIDNYDSLLELHLSASPSTFMEAFNFFKETGLITCDEDEINFTIAFYGDVNSKWQHLEDGKYTYTGEKR